MVEPRDHGWIGQYDGVFLKHGRSSFDAKVAAVFGHGPNDPAYRLREPCPSLTEEA